MIMIIVRYIPKFIIIIMIIMTISYLQHHLWNDTKNTHLLVWTDCVTTTQYNFSKLIGQQITGLFSFITLHHLLHVTLISSDLQAISCIWFQDGRNSGNSKYCSIIIIRIWLQTSITFNLYSGKNQCSSSFDFPLSVISH